MPNHCDKKNLKKQSMSRIMSYLCYPWTHHQALFTAFMALLGPLVIAYSISLIRINSTIRNNRQDQSKTGEKYKEVSKVLSKNSRYVTVESLFISSGKSSKVELIDCKMRRKKTLSIGDLTIHAKWHVIKIGSSTDHSARSFCSITSIETRRSRKPMTVFPSKT